MIINDFFTDNSLGWRIIWYKICDAVQKDLKLIERNSYNYLYFTWCHPFLLSIYTLFSLLQKEKKMYYFFYWNDTVWLNYLRNVTRFQNFLLACIKLDSVGFSTTPLISCLRHVFSSLRSLLIFRRDLW